MKRMRSKAGFTLVELVVVIAILAILAGIAVPVYSNYIKKAESAADMQMLSAVYTATQSLMAAEGATATGITVVKTGEVFEVTVTPTVNGVTSAAILELTGALEFSENFNMATWSSSTDWVITAVPNT